MNTLLTIIIVTDYVTSTIQTQISVISYFYKLPRRNTKLSSDMIVEIKELIVLTYTLIRQLIELLLFFISYIEILREQKLVKVDESVDFYDKIITVLKELLDLLSLILFCVIDNLKILNNRSITKHITVFINTLRDHRIYRNSLIKDLNRVLKILFTTTERSKSLLTNLKENKLIFVERANFILNSKRSSIERRSLLSTSLKVLKHNLEL